MFFRHFFSATAETTLHITSAAGLHLRPAARFVNEAKQFDCTITLHAKEKEADAKNLQALLSLGLRTGDKARLYARGDDAKNAAAHLSAFFESLMCEESAQATPRVPQTDDTPAYEGKTLCGTTLTRGVALAPLRHIRIDTKRTDKLDFAAALNKTLTVLRNEARHGAIYEAQATLLEETAQGCESYDMFKERIKTQIAALKDTPMAAKCDDYRDILGRIEAALGTVRTLRTPSTPFIGIGKALLPSDIDKLPQHIEGLVLIDTSPASHTAIVAQDRNIPVITLETTPQERTQAILDATKGCLVLEPSLSDIKRAEHKRNDSVARYHEAFTRRHQPAMTASGQHITVLANVGDMRSAEAAKEAGAEGIGLLRTEFLFEGNEAPNFETQRDAYARIFTLFDDVTVRTLDIGGDKPLPYVKVPQENNPFLGLRGIRLLRTHPDLFKTQLHALFDAARGKAFKLMFPMISTPEEFEEAKRFALDIAAKYRLSVDNVRFGMMLEVPSVLFALDVFDKYVDFYSVGTNDLTQYLFATERTHPSLHVAIDHPLLFRIIEHIIQHSDKPVGLCGELAAHPHATRKLIDAGLTTFSVNPSRIAELKERIRHV
jgi:phosphocarrier protein FPr